MYRTSYANRTRQRLHLEAFEDRRCLSAVVAFDAATATLSITGDNLADNVKVVHDASANQLHVIHDGQDQIFTGSDVDKIVVDLKGGNDTFTETLATGTNFSHATDVRIDMGNGRDTVDVALAGDASHWATLKENLYLKMYTGNGNDQIHVALPYVEIGNNLTMVAYLGAGADQFDAVSVGGVGTQAVASLNVFGEAGNDTLNYFGVYDPQSPAAGIKVADQGLLSVYFNGGAGQDKLGVDYAGKVDGTASFLLIGGDGGVQRDRVSIHTFTQPASNGTLSALADGGKGNDILRVIAEGSLPAMANITANGGDGKDECVNTYSVLVQNCEL
jgi:hypothetical protein